MGFPLKYRQAATITNAWKVLHTNLTREGVTPNIWVFDDKTSHKLQAVMNKYKTEHQFVPPHTRTANISERAIQTFKSYFKAGLAYVHPDFPIAEWDRLLKQCFLTSNLQRRSRLNSEISAYAFLFGNFDFNRIPFYLEDFKKK